MFARIRAAGLLVPAIMTLVMLPVLIALGAWLAWTLAGVPEKLFGTPYGRLLLANLAIGIVAMSLGALNKQVITAKVATDPATGRTAGLVMTGLILFVAASSLYATILGYSRIPYAAAKDGDFFRIFARATISRAVSARG